MAIAENLLQSLIPISQFNKGEDDFLLLEANKRMENNGNNKTLSFDSVVSNLGISEDELLDAEDVDIE